MSLYRIARQLKQKYNAYLKQRAGTFLYPIRRIERVFPPSHGKYVAMTFDDGPTAMPPNPGNGNIGLTETLLNSLNQYGAKGTFDCIGTTALNYPDSAGALGSFTWGGIIYDHYPDIHHDMLAGIANQPELVCKILADGHEVSNHSFRHILFGKNHLIYGKRKYYPNLHAVINDLNEFDQMMLAQHQVSVKLSRPPHYIDQTVDRFSAYDAYRYMNYQYLAASFDGGGWQVSGSYKRDVESMVKPLQEALLANSDALNGQIIFQKDGCNMNKETPVADALPQQLQILRNNAYQVITVSALLDLSPFEDLSDQHPVFSAALSLIRQGYAIAYRNNTVQVDRALTFGELIMMSANPARMLAVYRSYVDQNFRLTEQQKVCSRMFRISPSHPYAHAFYVAHEQGLLDEKNNALKLTSPVSAKVLDSFCNALIQQKVFTFNPEDLRALPIKRGYALEQLSEILS